MLTRKVLRARVLSFEQIKADRSPQYIALFLILMAATIVITLVSIALLDRFGDPGSEQSRAFLPVIAFLLIAPFVVLGIWISRRENMAKRSLGLFCPACSRLLNHIDVAHICHQGSCRYCGEVICSNEI